MNSRQRREVSPTFETLFQAPGAPTVQTPKTSGFRNLQGDWLRAESDLTGEAIPLAGAHHLSRNDVVENGEHTPRACGLRRRAANFSPAAVLHQAVGKFVGTKPAARRRRQNAGPMRPPFSTAYVRLRRTEKFMSERTGASPVNFSPPTDFRSTSKETRDWAEMTKRGLIDIPKAQKPLPTPARIVSRRSHLICPRSILACRDVRSADSFNHGNIDHPYARHFIQFNRLAPSRTR